MRELKSQQDRDGKAVYNHNRHLSQANEGPDAGTIVLYVGGGAVAALALAALFGAFGSEAPGSGGRMGKIGNKVLETGATALVRKGVSKLFYAEFPVPEIQLPAPPIPRPWET